MNLDSDVFVYVSQSCRSPENFCVAWNSQTPLLDLIQFGISFRIIVSQVVRSFVPYLRMDT